MAGARRLRRLVWVVVLMVRVVYGPPIAYIPRWVWPGLRERDPVPPWQVITFIAWAGMRGAVTLAAALAIPLSIDSGAAFPDRSLIIFLAFSVVLGSLVLQGLTLPGLVRLLGLEEDQADEAREEAEARIHAAEAALERLESSSKKAGCSPTRPSVCRAPTTSVPTDSARGSTIWTTARSRSARLPISG